MKTTQRHEQRERHHCGGERATRGGMMNPSSMLQPRVHAAYCLITSVQYWRVGGVIGDSALTEPEMSISLSVRPRELGDQISLLGV